MLKQYLGDYPQLLLPIQKGISKSENYMQMLQQVRDSDIKDDPFTGSLEDKEFIIETDIGSCTVLYLAERSDFVRFLQAVAFKSEPAEIPASTGAMTIFSVPNYRKLTEYEKRTQSGGTKSASSPIAASAWRDTVIVTTKGPYSRVSCQEAGFLQEEWLDMSLEIRMYHELAHVVARKRYPENRNALRDEVVADAVGLTSVLKRYDVRLARAFLGFGSKGEFVGGRISNYLHKDQSIKTVQSAILSMITSIAEVCEKEEITCVGLDLLNLIEKGKVGMPYFKGIS